MDLRQPSKTAAQGALCLRAEPGLARPPEALVRALQRRGVRGFRVAGRPRHDKPPRRDGPAQQDLHAREELRPRRVLRRRASPRDQVPRHRTGRPAVRGGCNGQSPGRRQARRVGPGGQQGPQGRYRSHREGVRSGDGPQERSSVSLRRWRVLGLPLPALHGRAPRLCGGADGRLFRRRSGQLHLPAPQPGRVLLPRLRQRKARAERALAGMEPRRRQGRRGRLRLRPSRIHGPPAHRRIPRAGQGLGHALRDPSPARGAGRFHRLLREGSRTGASRPQLRLRHPERPQSHPGRARGPERPSGHGQESRRGKGAARIESPRTRSFRLARVRRGARSKTRAGPSAIAGRRTPRS